VGGKRAPIIAGAAAAAIAVLAALFLVLPKMAQVRSADDKLNQATSQESTLRSQLAALKQARVDAPKARETIRRVEQAIPPTADQQGFILLMQNAADQSSIDLFSVTFGVPTFDVATGLSTVPATLNVTGGYFAVTELLFRIETLPRATKVEHITLAPSTSTGQTTGGISMTADVVFYTSDASAGPASSPGPTSPNGVTTGGAPVPAPVPSATPGAVLTSGGA